MKIQLWRNATVHLSIAGKKLLIDPMLGEKGSFGPFPWSKDKRDNPLVDLPFTDKELKNILAEVDFILVSHLHPDHWDETAVELLEKQIPIICDERIEGEIRKYGFTNIKAINDELNISGFNVKITPGLHGTGEIGEKMGEVNGFIVSANEDSIYFIGDSIYSDEIKQTVIAHDPDILIVAAGSAKFQIGDEVTMTAEQVIRLCKDFPEKKVVITHLEAVSPCTEDRNYNRTILDQNGLLSRCIIPEDGDWINFNI
ncbi:MBL fold metallo-hydrolase [Gramella sp. AN32]|uniref:MBL fold metallo-hydrolase n=1 Tax=Christiangramia antarctica TaxID=2058158 RepID=A0ABW5X598_9FLAO|nr:MBL fold metallo-hydrolase [Gramella sp. AN32]MCM4157818.1 MBL fold metallo-hydrolase [Gramella sp. AN32]